MKTKYYVLYDEAMLYKVENSVVYFMDYEKAQWLKSDYTNENTLLSVLGIKEITKEELFLKLL